MSSQLSHLECARCGGRHDPDVLQQRCACGGTLQARYELDPTDLGDVRARPSGMWRYEELLPLGSEPISLGEPQTPLVFLQRQSERWGVETWMKDDGILPSGTFKARGAAVAVSRAAELGATAIVMPTAGNAGAAWALYTARAGLQLTVVMSRTAPASQQAEVTAAGAELELVDGSIADAGSRAKQIASQSGALFAGTLSEPYRLEGKKTAWFELFDQCGDETTMRIPRTLIIPVGGGVAALAAAKAVEEVRALGWTTDAAPTLVGVQAQDCAPIVKAFEESRDDVPAWEQPTTTIAAGLRVPAPTEGALVLDRVRRSGGTMLAVAERDLRLSVRLLAATEGLFVCPEGAATVAAADRLARKGELEGPVVLYNTGSGIKYLDVL